MRIQPFDTFLLMNLTDTEPTYAAFKPLPAFPSTWISAAHRECRKAGFCRKRTAMTVINERTKGRSSYRHNRPEYLRAYYCMKCGLWHLTHKQPFSLADHYLSRDESPDSRALASA